MEGGLDIRLKGGGAGKMGNEYGCEQAVMVAWETVVPRQVDIPKLWRLDENENVQGVL